MKIKEKVFITNNSEETKKLASDFASDLKAGDIVCLYGDLGSGKTTFVQGLAEGLGIKNRIISPTFIIVRSYKVRINDERLMINDFYHVDLYRIDNEQDIEGLGLEEILNETESVVVIEWAEKMGSMLPKRRTDIRFEYVSEDKRRITVEKLT